MMRSVLAATAIVCVLTVSHEVSAQSTPPGTVIVTPDKLMWKASPRVAGVEVAGLVGDSTKQGSYVERVKFPADFKVQAHTHPEERTYTIISVDSRLTASSH